MPGELTTRKLTRPKFLLTTRSRLLYIIFVKKCAPVSPGRFYFSP
jgi:hypothetical protein